MGPTAAGKSALALALAERLGGEIVNADSKQVYRSLRVLTARPNAEDERRVPHHLYGFVDEAEPFSAGKWAPMARGAIEDISARGRVAIVVGGTGLYFKALTQGLAPAPAASPAARARVREELDALGASALHARLADLDPDAAARIGPADSVRILRALEIIEAGGGAPLKTLQAQARPLLAPGSWRGVALTPERASLYSAIDARFAEMLAHGALAEAETMRSRGLDAALPAMKAHGLPWLIKHLEGKISLEEAAALGARDTRRYAKRQTTWITGQLSAWPRIGEAAPERRLGAALDVFGW